ncbi:probable xyloglucan 6-xylosyltransferase 5 [Rosa rugosa]|uniref:probable xyloglucan 6-xylosyltransferase 5 n=1 Tax=Rosa rugosa TaxID=74645 RepID=UPI002B4054AF|nr:probable xyloglucan 6-xylosyltransferase 5 [Rosa rugosa]
MGQDNFTPQKQSSSGLPTTTATSARAASPGPVLPRGRQIQKTFNNIKITILCGFVTILVLCGTIGVGNLGSSEADAVNQNLIEEMNRILAEILSDSDPNDPDEFINGTQITYSDLMFDQKSWIAFNTGSFLFRNCQWSLDLLDAWAPMGPKGPIREEAGKVLTANLKGRPAFEADDQSTLIYLLLSQKDLWMEKVFVENSYYLHGYWAGLVDRYEEMIEKYHPDLGDERWPFVTHFVGCKPCGSYGDYPVERCLGSMEMAFNFADNQVLKLYGLVAGGGGLR